MSPQAGAAPLCRLCPRARRVPGTWRYVEPSTGAVSDLCWKHYQPLSVWRTEEQGRRQAALHADDERTES